MSVSLSYRTNEDEVLDRLRLFYRGDCQAGILASMNVPSKEIARFAQKYQTNYCEYPNPHDRIRFWDAFLRERSAINDDSVPFAYLTELDQGIYGGLLGGEVQFLVSRENGWISSMTKAVLDDWSQFENLIHRLKLDASNKWIRRFVNQTAIFVRQAKGKFGISHFTLIDGLNFVFELLGATKTYLSLVDDPVMVQKAIEFALDLNVKIQRLFFKLVPLLKGGTCSYIGQWIPGRIVDESVDPFHMTSVDYFEKWGREPIEKIFAEFDGGILHIHGNGRHLLPAVASLRGLKGIALGDDKGFAPSFEIIGKLKRGCLKNIPVIIWKVKYREFKEALHRHSLTGGVFYEIRDVPNDDEANQCMDKVRSYA